MASDQQADVPEGREDRRALLVKAAMELFKERPYDEVTTTEIARRAGVAYGLIAHYFTNKRGLYLATMTVVAERIRAVHQTPAGGKTPHARLRNGLTRHVRFVEENSAAFRALMWGGSGSDPQVRAVIEDVRWQSVSILLRAFGVTEPVRPALRTAMRGWTGYLDESILDYLGHRDLSRDDLVSLAITTLVAALRGAHAIDPRMGIEPALIDLLGD